MQPKLQGKKISVFGGNGFIGKTVIQKLAKAGALIQVGVRNPSDALFLKSMGEVGQITLHPFKLNNFSQIQNILKGSEAVINLIGILFEKRKMTFEAIHHQGAKLIAEACLAENVSRLIHLSAIGAHSQASSRYAVSKGRAEETLRHLFPETTILRPSIVFGPDDRFFNWFAALATISPFLPIFGQGKNKFQPVYVGDIADAVANLLVHPQKQGKIYELGGPEILTFHDLLKLVLKHSHQNARIVSFPYFLGKIGGWFTQFLPRPPLTLDQVRLLQLDNIVSDQALGFKELDIVPQRIEPIISSYLGRYKPHF